MPIQKGDVIKIEYVGTFDDETVFDTSQNHGPLEFEVGAGQLIKGFDDAVLGMDVGQEKTIHLEPKDAYGDFKEEYVKNVPKDKFSPEQKPYVGMPIVLRSPEGMQFRAVVKAMNDTDVTLDLNHPLAGKSLNFTFKILEKKEK